MGRFVKMLVIASLLIGAVSFLTVDTAEAGGYRSHFAHSYHHNYYAPVYDYYTPVYHGSCYTPAYYAPTYHYVAPVHGYGYGYGHGGHHW